MPQCRLCKAPIFFLTEEPRDVIVGNSYPPKGIRTQPKPHPIDVNPSPDGNISLYQNPSPASVFATHGGYKGPFPTYFRRNYGDVLLSLMRRYEIALYASHFDTCPARRGEANRLQYERDRARADNAGGDVDRTPG